MRTTVLALSSMLLLAACPEPTPDNSAPVAEAGEDFEVLWGNTVVLRGTCTDADPADLARLSYQWDLVSTPDASALGADDLRGRTSSEAFLLPDAPGGYTFTLRCSDGSADSAEDTVTATVLEPPPNRPPAVDAGRDAVGEVGERAVVVAEASDPDADPLTWRWTFDAVPAGSSRTDAELTGAAAAEASFVPDVAGDYVLRVTVTDGREGEAFDTTTVGVVEVLPMDGRVEVRVVDDTLAPIGGARVALGARLLDGTTDQSGTLVFEEPGLAGPLDVTVSVPGTASWDHDGDPATPRVDAPTHALTTVTAFDRPGLTVVVERTAAGRDVSGRGRITGAVPQALFDRLPQIKRMFSIAGAEVSGQLRVVLVAPVIEGAGVADLDIDDLLTPAPSPSVPLPGNMTTDDPFLNENANLAQREPGPDGEPAFTLLSIPAPVGTQRFYVLGGLATVDIARLLPLLTAGAPVGTFNSEMGAVMSAIDLATLFVGVFEAQVEDGAETDITDLLGRPEEWSLFAPVSFDQATETESVCDEADFCVDLERVRVFPHDSITVDVAPLGADPRLAAEVPDTSPFEILCDEGGAAVHCDPPTVIELGVPADLTETDLPYGLDLVTLELPPGHALAPVGGVVVVGYRFARAPEQNVPQVVFPVPKLEGGLAGLTYSAAAVAFRRLGTRDSDGAFFYRPGRAVDIQGRLEPGAAVLLEPGHELPRLAEASGGLDVEVLFRVEDPLAATPVVTYAHAMVVGPAVPEASVVLPEALTHVGGAAAALRVLRLAEVDRSVAGGERAPSLSARWTILYPGDATDLPIPALPAGFAPLRAGTEVWGRLAGYRFRGPFTYQKPEPSTYLMRRRVLVEDAWSFRAP